MAVQVRSVAEFKELLTYCETQRTLADDGSNEQVFYDDSIRRLKIMIDFELEDVLGEDMPSIMETTEVEQLRESRDTYISDQIRLKRQIPTTVNEKPEA